MNGVPRHVRADDGDDARSNTYGPYQYPEKLLPVAITNALDGKPIPVYGDGLQVRDWLHVDDHCDGIDLALHDGVPGEAYNIGAEHEGRATAGRTSKCCGRSSMSSASRTICLQFVGDRPGHDRRYALECAKLHALGWQTEMPFPVGLERTVRWYAEQPRLVGATEARCRIRRLLQPKLRRPRKTRRGPLTRRRSSCGRISPPRRRAITRRVRAATRSNSSSVRTAASRSSWWTGRGTVSPRKCSPCN